MLKIAFITLAHTTPRASECHIELLEIDSALAAVAPAAARYLVSVRQGAFQAGVMVDAKESSLTPAPCTRDEAMRRVLDFAQRRIAAGARITRQEGLPVGAFATASTNANEATPEVSASKVNPSDAAVPAHIAALVKRLEPDEWKLVAPPRKTRTVWRIAECSDSASQSATQRALVALVPRLIGLLETGEDALDYCIAYALARLGDTGAANALQHLSTRGRGEPTRRIARQAWLLLSTAHERSQQLETLLSHWQVRLKSAQAAPEKIALIEANLVEQGSSWPQLLSEWYELALIQPEQHAALLEVLRVIAIKPGIFQGLRRIYKAAELRRDELVLGVLHSRFEMTRAYFNNRGYGAKHGFHLPETQAYINVATEKELKAKEPRIAYSNRTRDYFRLRAWRSLRRLAALNHAFAPTLAVQLLLGLDDELLPSASVESRWQYVGDRYAKLDRHYQPSCNWLIVPKLLFANDPQVKTSSRATRWWTTEPRDDSLPIVQPLAAQSPRTEGLAEMWNAHPEALVQLCVESRAQIVHVVAARALNDHLEFVAAQPTDVLKRLVSSAYLPPRAWGLRWFACV